jgi:ABC-type transporter Mla subunit MlaD
MLPHSSASYTLGKGLIEVDESLNWFLGHVFLVPFNFVFEHQWVPPFVLMPLMFGWAWHVQAREKRKTHPFIVAAGQRRDTLDNLLGAQSDPVRDRKVFSDSYIEISAAMNEDQAEAKALVETWREFQETLIIDEELPIRNTTRPAPFFLRAIPRQTTLTFWSNIFVGIGLILTFVGLIVALNKAAGSMGGDTHAQMDALKGLLSVAGAKFFTSVAGIGASIWLRSVEHQLTAQASAPIHRICELLERGLLYVSPQKLASEQLEVLKEQRDQLKTFNTDFAVQLSEAIGGRFSAVMDPFASAMSQQLGEMNHNIATMTQGVGEGARKAIQDVSGAQMQDLANTLASLRDKLDGISEGIDASGNTASQMIKDAGEQFLTASMNIQVAFGTLAETVGGLGAKLQEQGEAAAQKQDDALQRILSGLEESQKQMGTAIADAITTLSAAGQKAAGEFEKQVGDVIDSSTAENIKHMNSAFADSSKSLREAIDSLSEAIESSSKDVFDAGVQFERSATQAGQTATSMTQVVGSAEQVSQALQNVAAGVSQATGPMVEAARNSSETARKIASSIDAYTDGQGRALEEMRSLAEGVKQTHSAAEGAWRDYRARFEGVDQALGKTLDGLTGQLSSALGDFRKFAQDTDRQLADAVSKLSGATTPIAEYAESLDEFVEDMRRSRKG